MLGGVLMANSGPGWEGIDLAWGHLNDEVERERLVRQRTPESSPAGAETPPSPSCAGRAPTDDVGGCRS